MRPRLEVKRAHNCPATMGKARLEAFTDGVIAIIITIMVLEMKVPSGADPTALAASAPVFSAYVLSYINVGIFWLNHHHMMHATGHIDGRVLWANLALLFWLSLVPFMIRWIDEAGFAPLPTAAYGVVLAMAGISYRLMQTAIIARNGRDSALALYLVSVPLAFFDPRISIALYIVVAAMWFVPDRRIESKVK